MGKGTITGEIGEAKYNVEIDTGSAALAARVAKLNAEIVEWQAEKVTADAFLVAELAKGPPLLANIDALIVAYKTATSTGEGVEEALVAVNAAVVARAEWNLSIFSAGAPADQLASLIAQAQKDITTLNGFDVTSNESLWCADFTLEADGECGIIEVPGESKTMLIVPEALAPTGDDGEVVARPVQDSAQLFYNLAILPGWQKFKPTYRFGTLAGIDYDGDTGSVTLETAYSSAQNLNVNQTGFLSNVPIEYMTCNAVAFENGDQVVVKFTGQDWATPKVVGFKSNPKPCGAYKLAFMLESNITSSSFIGPFNLRAGQITSSTVYPSPGQTITTTNYDALVYPIGRPAGKYQVTINIRVRFDCAWKQLRRDSTYFENFRTGGLREKDLGIKKDIPAVIPPGSTLGWDVAAAVTGITLGRFSDTREVVSGLDQFGNEIDNICTGTTVGMDYYYTQPINASNPNYFVPGLDRAHATAAMLESFPSVPQNIKIRDILSPSEKYVEYELETYGPPCQVNPITAGQQYEIPTLAPYSSPRNKSIPNIEMAIYKLKGAP